jgi:hypothetical protein
VSARLGSGWCARRIQVIYTGSGQRMSYVQWGRGSCIILHQSACSRGYKRVREAEVPRSQDVSGEYVCVASDESNNL